MDFYKYNVAGESDEAVITAVWTLMSIKYSKLDQHTARKLQHHIKKTTKGTDESKNKKYLQIKPNVLKSHKKSHRSNRKSKSRKSNDPLPLAEMTRPALPELQDLMGLCSRPLEKRITESDVNRGLTRLLLNRSMAEAHLVTMLDKDEKEKIKEGIPVTVYGPDGGEYAMNFKLWCDKFYVLSGGSWKDMCQVYNLEAGDGSTVWMFRHKQTNGICFAIELKKNGSSPKLAADERRKYSRRLLVLE